MLQSALGQYITVTASYWAFTLTDGALRMLIVLFFHQLGYSPLEVAMLFLLYEFFGMVTNLVGGWLAARVGLNITMHIGLLLQIGALAMLLVDESLLVVGYVMVAQALSGIAKDLNKMSAKSSIKMLIAKEAQGKLYYWVSVLTGSKNAMKGLGFFMGGALLTSLGFQGAILVMVAGLVVILLASCCLLQVELGKASYKPKFKEVFSKSAAVNRLSAARFFLFGARDVWFVVALPVYLHMELDWSHIQVGTLLASWLIGYGVVQGLSPKITQATIGTVPDGKTAWYCSWLLAFIPVSIALLMYTELPTGFCIVTGLLVFGAVFAVNSSLHSYLIVSYAKEEGTSLDVGFYYMANAAGRLLGTVLSGWVFQSFGFSACLLVSSMLLVFSTLLARHLPRSQSVQT